MQLFAKNSRAALENFADTAELLCSGRAPVREVAGNLLQQLATLRAVGVLPVASVGDDAGRCLTPEQVSAEILAIEAEGRRMRTRYAEVLESYLDAEREAAELHDACAAVGSELVVVESANLGLAQEAEDCDAKRAMALRELEVLSHRVDGLAQHPHPPCAIRLFEFRAEIDRLKRAAVRQTGSPMPVLTPPMATEVADAMSYPSEGAWRCDEDRCGNPEVAGTCREHSISEIERACFASSGSIPVALELEGGKAELQKGMPLFYASTAASSSCPSCNRSSSDALDMVDGGSSSSSSGRIVQCKDTDRAWHPSTPPRSDVPILTSASADCQHQVTISRNRRSSCASPQSLSPPRVHAPKLADEGRALVRLGSRSKSPSLSTAEVSHPATRRAPFGFSAPSALACRSVERRAQRHSSPSPVVAKIPGRAVRVPRRSPSSPEMRPPDAPGRVAEMGGVAARSQGGHSADVSPRLAARPCRSRVSMARPVGTPSSLVASSCSQACVHASTPLQNSPCLLQSLQTSPAVARLRRAASATHGDAEASRSPSPLYAPRQRANGSTASSMMAGPCQGEPNCSPLCGESAAPFAGSMAGCVATAELGTAPINVPGADSRSTARPPQRASLSRTVSGRTSPLRSAAAQERKPGAGHNRVGRSSLVGRPDASPERPSGSAAEGRRRASANDKANAKC